MRAAQVGRVPRSGARLHTVAEGRETFCEEPASAGDLFAFCGQVDDDVGDRDVEAVSGLTDDLPAAMRVCRMCDREACGVREGRCPLGHTKGAEVGS